VGAPGRQVLHYDKRHLFRMAGEHATTPPASAGAVRVKGWRIRPLICYDLRFPVWSRDAQDTDLLLYTANWPAARRQHWNRLLPARAIENLCYVAAVNRVGRTAKGTPIPATARCWTSRATACWPQWRRVFHASLSGQALADYRKRFPANLDADRFIIEP
jgi:predicted amidohydrolase